MTRLDPPIPLQTPKGDAMAYFVIDYGTEHDLMWVCFQDDTGECWSWHNPHIRLRKNYTSERINISPIEHDVFSKKVK